MIHLRTRFLLQTRCFALLLAFCMLFCLPALAAYHGDWDDEYISETVDGHEVLYTGDYAYIVKDGQATIIGYGGSMYGWDNDRFDRFHAEEERADDSGDYDYMEEGGWEPYVLTIPNRLDGHPVVAIYDEAFVECMFTGVTLPNGLVSIGASAFSYSYYFDTLVIPHGVESIGNYAFGSCLSLTDVTIPESVTHIGADAFEDCGIAAMQNGLVNFDADVWLTLHVKKGSYAEQYAENEGIGYDWMDVKASGNWRYILEGNHATIAGYVGEPEGSLLIPRELDGHAVTGIGSRAFEECLGITGIVIPDGVTDIGSFAFTGCAGITRVTMPYSVTNIGDWAFAGCEALTSILIPSGVTRIGDYGFADCKSLLRVTISNSVRHIGDYAFSGCGSLESVTIPNSVRSIGECAFYECGSLTSVIIPTSVTSIGYRTFYGCGSLTSVVIPSSVTVIDIGAFYGCGGLTSVLIPASVTDIGYDAFGGCSKVVLSVKGGSYAEQFAKSRGIKYVQVE